MSIPIHSLHHTIASPPAGKALTKSVHTNAFSTLFGGLVANKPSRGTPGTGATAGSAAQQPTTPAAASPAVPSPPRVVTSSVGTSLANLMAAASYAGVPYADLGQTYNTPHGTFDPNWQQKMADALEARLKLVAGPGISNQVYDPNPANDSVPVDLTNTKPFFSSADQMQGLLNTMWSAVHAGDVNGYHTALQNVDAFYQSNGQQNYQTGLTDGQVAAFDPANRAAMIDMPNANSAVASAELAAITGQSASATNLGAIAQSVLAGTLKT